ncbi:GDSL esterase/lipase At1g29670 [Cajanus cajan]|uniref:GDSL esterase/lipase At1g29670 family n=1 Tax=Cajanus cajan TaxID=3821 RepID=A0A151R1P7_CAJCA|nr:GDSL esterase/lipase At1g29670 [Cajanus cajan]KYP36375.1 GDSL esterase/lipase At1g29670 family [Cajanus cajan]
MAIETKPWLVLSLLLLAANCVDGESQLPCVFIFGDSLSDSGNNNNLPTFAKSNYLPYGIDFPNGPTGRFTNGRTSIDFATELLGFEKFIPPFANTRGFDIQKGVNYASGSAGIRPETGTHMGADIYLGAQVKNHEVIYSKIAEKLGGSEKAKLYLSKCLYYMNIGSNDFINNYFLPNFYPTSRIYTPLQYVHLLIDQYAGHIQDLREVGARKFVIVGLSLIGCTPSALSRYKTHGSCVKELNDASILFNNKLKSLVDRFNINFFAHSIFIFINNTVVNPGTLPGLDVLDAPCCLSGENGQCIPDKIPCKNVDAHLFWDQFHTTQAVNQFTAKSLYNDIKLLIVHHG